VKFEKYALRIGVASKDEIVDNTAIMISSLDSVVVGALRCYDVSPESTVTLINVSENTTYLVDDPRTGQRAALRIHRPNYHSRESIESELCWLDALREDGVVEPPRAIAARDGSRVITVAVEGDGPPRHIVMFEWLQGRAPDTDGDLVPSFRVLGTLAAKMHVHGTTWKPPAWFNRYSCDYDAALGTNAMWGRWQNGLGLGVPEQKILSRLDIALRDRLVEYGKRNDRFGLCHNDLRLTNLLVDGEHIHVIDFDDCGFGWYMYDFATAVSFYEADPRVRDWMDSWIAGYVEKRALSSSDADIIPTLVMFRRLLLVGWVGSHHEYAKEAAALGAEFTSVTCDLAEDYLVGKYLT
jgi:Ser/Thr protein kinase RdoA (MazF antagonist)